MWQSRTFGKSKKNVNEDKSEEKNQDSGFLSGSDLQVSGTEISPNRDDKIDDEGVEFLSRRENKKSVGGCFSTKSTIPEPMRTDSGVDVGLSETLSQLTLKPVTLNQLGTEKIQIEPTFELIPVADKKIQIDKSKGQEPWQFYYTQDDDGDTLLHMAIIQGFLEAAFSLIRMAPHPCLLDITNDEWQSPLHLAIITRQSRIARRLILAGANPALRNHGSNTALHLVCNNGDIACAKALTDPLTPLERSYFLPGMNVPALPQDLEQRNEQGQTCLHVAASHGHIELVRLLLRLGADLDAREGLSGNTPLHLAILYDRRAVVAFLLEECRPGLDTPTYAGYTAYQIALSITNIQLARELVKFGATPEPLPEDDSEDEDDTPTSNYLPDMLGLRRNVVGV